MEATALCFRLLMFEFLLEMHIQSSYPHKSEAVLLRVDPNRLQLFDDESLSFRCVGTDGPIKLKGAKNAKEFHRICKIIKTSSSSCTISKTYHTDNGEYWCESGAGERSNSVNITITAGSVILDSPAFPVFKGDNVTFRCKSRNTSMKQRADFYKGSDRVKGSPSDQMMLHNVSKSDEGFYKCSIAGVGTSPESFLAVGANTVSITSPTLHEEMPSDEPASPRGLALMLVPLMVLLLLLLVVAFIYCMKSRASSKTSAAASNSGEAASAVSGVEDDVTYAAVFTRRRPDEVPDAADVGDNLSHRFESDHSRNPATEEDADESSLQPVYSNLKEELQSGSSGSMLALNPSAAKESSLEEQEIIYSAVQTKQRSERPN